MHKYDVGDSDSTPTVTLARLEAAMITPHLGDAVRRYFENGSTFAGNTFDSLGRNPRDEIASDDLLAVTLLDVSWKPNAVRAILFEQAEMFSALLQDVSSDTTLWDVDHGCQQLTNADPLWKAIDALPGVGPTRTSKLLARKRPLLVPITDRIVVSAIGGGDNWWRTLRYCFMQESFRDAAERLRPQAAEDVSLLRIFDVAIWMLCSKSRDARRVRNDAGVPRDSCHRKPSDR
jgi:hypothetical protein